VIFPITPLHRSGAQDWGSLFNFRVILPLGFIFLRWISCPSSVELTNTIASYDLHRWCRAYFNCITGGTIVPPVKGVVPPVFWLVGQWGPFQNVSSRTKVFFKKWVLSKKKGHHLFWRIKSDWLLRKWAKNGNQIHSTLLALRLFSSWLLAPPPLFYSWRRHCIRGLFCW